MMKNKGKFLELCRKNYSGEDLGLIVKAVEFIELNLEGERKFSKKPLFDFNIDIGEILVLSGMTAESVVAGILYSIFFKFVKKWADKTREKEAKHRTKMDRKVLSVEAKLIKDSL